MGNVTVEHKGIKYSLFKGKYSTGQIHLALLGNKGEAAVEATIPFNKDELKGNFGKVPKGWVIIEAFNKRTIFEALVKASIVTEVGAVKTIAVFDTKWDFDCVDPEHDECPVVLCKMVRCVRLTKILKSFKKYVN